MIGRINNKKENNLSESHTHPNTQKKTISWKSVWKRHLWVLLVRHGIIVNHYWPSISPNSSSRFTSRHESHRGDAMKMSSSRSPACVLFFCLFLLFFLFLLLLLLLLLLFSKPSRHRPIAFRLRRQCLPCTVRHIRRTESVARVEQFPTQSNCSLHRNEFDWKSFPKHTPTTNR